MSLITLLGVLFIGLKLAGIIAWSWWIVLLPLYAFPVFLFSIIVGIIVRAVTR